MMIDLKRAEEEFLTYVADFDVQNPRIAIKISHTKRVILESKALAESLNLEAEEVALAQLIALLHDIGRFEQVRIYNTFSDKKSVNHAELGVQILFDDNLIRKFINDKKYDRLIKAAILNHNRLNLEEIRAETPNLQLQAKILRDADMLDFFPTFLAEKLTDIYNEQPLTDLRISSAVIEKVENREAVDFNLRKNVADIIVSQLAFVFNLEFSAALAKVKQQRYIPRMIAKLDFLTGKTRNDFLKIEQMIEEYLDECLQDKCLKNDMLK